MEVCGVCVYGGECGGMCEWCVCRVCAWERGIQKILRMLTSFAIQTITPAHLHTLMHTHTYTCTLTLSHLHTLTLSQLHTHQVGLVLGVGQGQQEEWVGLVGGEEAGLVEV